MTGSDYEAGRSGGFVPPNGDWEAFRAGQADRQNGSNQPISISPEDMPKAVRYVVVFALLPILLPFIAAGALASWLQSDSFTKELERYARHYLVSAFGAFLFGWACALPLAGRVSETMHLWVIVIVGCLALPIGAWFAPPLRDLSSRRLRIVICLVSTLTMVAVASAELLLASAAA